MLEVDNWLKKMTFRDRPSRLTPSRTLRNTSFLGAGVNYSIYLLFNSSQVLWFIGFDLFGIAGFIDWFRIQIFTNTCGSSIVLLTIGTNTCFCHLKC